MEKLISEKAKETVSENERIIASQRDSEFFFNAIFQQTKPNKSLLEAAGEYNQTKQQRF